MAYETDDFFLAVYLLTEGFTLLNVQKEESGDKSKELFLFESTSDLEDKIQAYRTDRARVNPQAFGQNIMKLRALLRK